MVPKIVITKEEMKELLDRNCNVTEMAEHFKVTVSTIYRHLRLMNISLREHRKSMLAETSGSKIVCRRQGNFSNLKNVFLSTESNDQSVLAPLSLFHIGGYFKLSGYGFVIHTCIDVYSRFITYLDVSNNNNASTVLRLFQSGIAELGLPTRVRCDNGMENVGVVHFMDINRPLVNDRIVYQRVVGRLHHVLIKVGTWLQRYIDLFKEMETCGNLDKDSNLDLYCLHLCFTHLMKSHLKECRENWNNRQSTKTTTPRQLSLIGLMSLRIRAKIDKAYYPELDQSNITFVEEQEWGATEKLNSVNVNVREFKHLVEPNIEIDLDELFQLKTLTIQTAPEVYCQLRLHLQSTYNLER